MTSQQIQITRLIKAGYSAKMLENGKIEVQDPVMCGNGLEKWVEYVPVVLDGETAVTRFMIVRD